jgi:hypothetical protein
MVMQAIRTPHPEDDAHSYGKRLARALAQSLIDQLADLKRETRAKKLG